MAIQAKQNVITLATLILVRIVGKEKLMENKCKNCKYCHGYKKLVDGEWEYSNCCTYWVQAEDVSDYASTVLYTEEDDICEMFISNK